MTQSSAKSPTASKLQPVATSTHCILVDVPSLLQRMKQIHEKISQRAHDLFESRGHAHGHDVDDWLHAESELLCAVPVEINESEEQLIVRADMPGFSAADIEVAVESQRVFISATKDQRSDQRDEKTVHTEERSERVFRIVDPPSRVDSSKVTARLKDQTLQVMLPKVAASG